MNSIFRLLSILLIAGTVAACQTTPSGPVEVSLNSYSISCAPKINKGAFTDTGDSYVFKLDQGDVGGCWQDKKGYKDNYVSFTHSERQEITWPLNKGLTVFEADILMVGADSRRTTFFQVHDGEQSRNPPTWIGVGKNWKTLIAGVDNNGIDFWKTFSTIDIKKDETFHFVAKLFYVGDTLAYEYYVNGVKIFEKDDVQIDIHHDSFYRGKPQIKIGMYRINAKGTTTFTYSNVKIVKNHDALSM